ncbi:MAG: peptidase, partial [Nitrososphaerales archaeon]
MYGWVKDLPDSRDYRYVVPPELSKNLPLSVDLRPSFPRVYNQGNLNSCTANAIAAALEFDEIRQKVRKPFVPSRLFIYYNEREMEGSVDSDSGAQIRSGIKAVARLGGCPEDLWPYLEGKLKIRPLPRCYRRAVRYKAL